MAIVYGSNSSETINAADGVSEFADTIYGYGGNDTIYGLGGNDFIIGGLGADTINGGSGIDAAFYSDSATGVTVSLATGKGSGGTAQGDTLISIENLYGSAYDDTLTGNSDNNILNGMGGNDLLKGGGGADTLNGGDGDDLLLGGSGGDTMYGGNGIDTISYAGSSEGVAVFLGGEQTNFGGDAEGDSFSGIENLTGSSHNDRLDGDKHANVIIGLDGNDTIDGRGGADTMIGGKGDDDYYVQNVNDVVIENAGEGYDTLGTTVSYTLAAGVSIEYFAVNGENTKTDLNLTGNEFDQRLSGNDGNNILDGAGGIDKMQGWNGDDTYYADNTLDTVVEFAGEGYDVVYSTASVYTLSDNVEVLSLANGGSSVTHGTGNAQNNTVFGNAFDNVLDGGAGADTLSGLGGNDGFVFHAGEGNGDTVYEFEGNGAAVGDFLYFVGYGTAAQGATFVQLTATSWQINSADGLTHDVITFVGGPTIDASDFGFL